MAVMLDQADKAAAHGHFAVAAVAVDQARRLAADQPAGAGTMEIAAQLEERSLERGARGREPASAAEMHAALGARIGRPC